MKICHFTSVHPRYDIRIFEKECSSLATAGYEVYLVVNDNMGDEEKNGVKIISTNFIPKNRLERIFNSTKLVYKKALQLEADVYHFHDPELLPFGLKLKKLGKKVIFDSHEDTEIQIMDKKWIPLVFRPLVSKSYGKYSRKIMSKLDLVITVTPSLTQKYMKNCKNVLLVTNYPKIQNFEIPSKTDKPLFQYVFFAGGVSEQWCHEKIISSLNPLKDIYYLIAGRGDKNYIDCLTTNQKVKYLGVLSHDEVMSYYDNSIAGMALLNCAQVGTEGTLGNTKLFEIMLSEKPVICSNLRLWKEIIEKYDCGICIECNSPKQIMDAISYLSDNPEKAKQMGENGKKAVLDVFNWSIEEKKLINQYKEFERKSK